MMSTVVPLLIIFLILVVFIRIFVFFSEQIKFCVAGLDSGFGFKEIRILWLLANAANLENPSALFWSIPAIDRSIAMAIKNSQNRGTENSKKTQAFLERLYAYRTKIELDPKNRKGIKSTKSIDNGQRLRVLLKKYGVFSSKVINNGRELVISLPLKNKQIVLAGSDWVDKSVSVYFHRYGDASYVFDTVVRNTAQFSSVVCLYLTHSENLFRTQKRKAVRSECSFSGQIFLNSVLLENGFEAEKNIGLKCRVEDISESGALIRIGGQGKAGIRLKLQFELNGKPVVMQGVVRSVEYNKTSNLSRMHFQCQETSQVVKNNILAYVYSMLSQDSKDVFDAIQQADADDEEDTNEINIPDALEFDEDEDEDEDEDIEELKKI